MSIFDELYTTYTNLLNIDITLLPNLQDFNNNNFLHDLTVSLPAILTIATIIIFFILVVLLLKNLILIWFK